VVVIVADTRRQDGRSTRQRNGRPSSKKDRSTRGWRAVDGDGTAGETAPTLAELPEPAPAAKSDKKLSDWRRVDLVDGSAITNEVIDEVGIHDDEADKGWRLPWGDKRPFVHDGKERLGYNIRVFDRDKRPVTKDKDGKPKEKKLDWPPGMTLIPNVLRKVDSGQTLLAEGSRQQLTALSYAPDDFSVVGMAGVNGIHDGIRDRLWWTIGQDVYLVVDADRHTNPQVRRGVERDAGILYDEGAETVYALDLAPYRQEENDGLDDILARLPEHERAAFLAKLIDEAEKVNRRPRLNVANAAIVGAEIRRTLGRGELAGLFRRGGAIVHTPRVDEDGYVPPDNELDEDGPAQVQMFDRDQLKALVEIRYDCGVVVVDRETGDKSWMPKLVPDTAAKSAHEGGKLGLDSPSLRVLRGVTHTPVVRPDGSVLYEPGYDSSTGLLYLPDIGLEVPPVPDRPTREQIREAKALFLTLTDEFPFVTPDHRAAWIAFTFTPLLRPLIKPPYPLELITAPQRGSGKGFLAKIQRGLHGGVFRSSFPKDADEQRKAIRAILLTTTAPYVQWDNIRGVFRSSVMEGLLTSAEWDDRNLGVLKNLDLRNDRVWIVTANNATLGGDLSRRSLTVKIDAKSPAPHRRTGFKIHPPTYVAEHRGELLAAMLTLARGWVLDGRQAKEITSDDYMLWLSNLGGFLDWMEFPGHLDGAADVTPSEDDAEWGEWLAAHHDAFGDEPATVAQIVEQLRKGSMTSRPGEGIDPTHLPGELADRWAKTSATKVDESAFGKKLGWWYRNRVDQYADGWKVERVEINKATIGWKVVKP
jgi:hypothetical protein